MNDDIFADILNKVIHGDSYDELQDFPDNSIPVIITDPPYNLDMETITFYHEQLMGICSGVIIVFCPPENQWEDPADQYLFWEKPISTKNTTKSYSRFVEMIYIYGRHVWNSDRNWSQYTNVFHDLVDESNLHPHRKPFSLIKRLVLNHSNPGDIILDPFCGSGVVGEVCMATGRNFIGIEKDQKYAEMSQSRIDAYG